MHAAEAAGREQPDAGPLGQVRGRGHRRRRAATPGHDEAQVAHARLRDVVAFRDGGQRGVVQADPRDPVHDRDGCRDRARRSHGVLDFARDPQVVRSRQPVADDGRLQRDHRRAGLQRLLDLRRDLDRTGFGGVSQPAYVHVDHPIRRRRPRLARGRSAQWTAVIMKR
jgi:hypothetical protein